MENNDIKTTTRMAAVITFTGSLCMILGAILMVTSGADLDSALNTDELQAYLITAHENKMLVIANLSVWIVGVILLGAAGILMASLGLRRQVMARLAKYNYAIAIPIVVCAYTAWLAIVVRISPDSIAAAEISEAMGWFASRADWIATILVLGTGPRLISLAGRNDWIPKWLSFWSFIALFTGLLNAVAMFAGGLTTYGFLIIPVGMSWMFAASIVLFKKMNK